MDVIFRPKYLNYFQWMNFQMLGKISRWCFKSWESNGIHLFRLTYVIHEHDTTCYSSCKTAIHSHSQSDCTKPANSNALVLFFMVRCLVKSIGVLFVSILWMRWMKVSGECRKLSKNILPLNTFQIRNKHKRNCQFWSDFPSHYGHLVLYV